MSKIFEKLKAAAQSERTVELEGETIVVKGLKRSERNRIQTEATSARGKLNGVLFEAMLLAACCYDKAGEYIQPDYRDWDLQSHITGPLVAAVVEVNGLDDEEVKALVKKSDTTPS